MPVGKSMYFTPEQLGALAQLEDLVQLPEELKPLKGISLKAQRYVEQLKSIEADKSEEEQHAKSNR